MQSVLQCKPKGMRAKMPLAYLYILHVRMACSLSFWHGVRCTARYCIDILHCSTLLCWVQSARSGHEEDKEHLSVHAVVPYN